MPLLSARNKTLWGVNEHGRRPQHRCGPVRFAGECIANWINLEQRRWRNRRLLDGWSHLPMECNPCALSGTQARGYAAGMHVVMGDNMGKHSGT